MESVAITLVCQHPLNMLNPWLGTEGWWVKGWGLRIDLSLPDNDSFIIIFCRCWQEAVFLCDNLSLSAHMWNSWFSPLVTANGRASLLKGEFFVPFTLPRLKVTGKLILANLTWQNICSQCNTLECVNKLLYLYTQLLSSVSLQEHPLISFTFLLGPYIGENWH